MSQQTAGSILANILKLKGAGAPQEELDRKKKELGEQIVRQVEVGGAGATVTVVSIGDKFLRAGHQPESKTCNHSHYNFKTHGRVCTCGTTMVDFGD
jgi:hypothetical protein